MPNPRNRLLRRLIPALALALSLTLTGHSWATAVAAKMSLERMAREADAVVVGRCSTSQSRWLDGNLVTLTTVEVEQTWKGLPQPAIFVILPGGTDTSGPVPLAQDVSGAPTLRHREEVLLFLRRVEGLPEAFPTAFTILGFSQGKFTILRDGDAVTALQNLGGLMLLDGQRMSAGATTHRTLDGLQRRIRPFLDPLLSAPPTPLNTQSKP